MESKTKQCPSAFGVVHSGGREYRFIGEHSWGEGKHRTRPEQKTGISFRLGEGISEGISESVM